MMRTFGVPLARDLRDARIVPPVPTPATKTASTWPSVSAQVCADGRPGLAGLVNWEAMMAPGRSEARALGLGDGRGDAALPGRWLGTEGADDHAALGGIEAGMTMTTQPRAAVDRAIPVLPEVASTIVPPGLAHPGLGRVDDRAGDDRFTEAGLKASYSDRVDAVAGNVVNSDEVPPIRSATVEERCSHEGSLLSRYPELYHPRSGLVWFNS